MIAIGRAVAVIPALNEAGTIAGVLRGLPPGLRAVVVDGGSRDETAALAAAAGAVVIHEPRPGYGRACLSGAERAAALGAAAVLFLDGGGTADPADALAVLGPVLEGRAELVLGSRVLGPREPGALRPLQRAGNALACALIRLRFGARYSDLGATRAVRLDSLRALELREMAHGWPVEMQIKAAARGLGVLEVPVRARRRRAGRSKVSGSARGTARAGAAILRVIARESL